MPIWSSMKIFNFIPKIRQMEARKVKMTCPESPTAQDSAGTTVLLMGSGTEFFLLQKASAPNGFYSTYRMHLMDLF